ncbi:response regulator [Spirosoma rhododendri]|uniref:Response regulator n=1 Tax=Spirosoma rhododendri TaxID=2728024 RepID=A0A7L5DU83_9BACT|nr:response regulator [Spirosoma rhododendri]QJD81031.1 response regulator [Spirosoma rhododendri]
MRNDLSDTRILLVDDNPLNLMLIRKLVTKWGASVDTAENGEKAVELSRDGTANRLPYQAIIMDLQMPVMDGATACQLIRQFDSSVAILASSATALPQAELDASGFTGSVVKPFESAQLRQQLLSILSE